MPKRGLVLWIVGAGLAGCVSTRTASIDDSRAAQWRGKSVAVTQRPETDFLAVTAGKAAFALAGVVAMLEAGKTIVRENGIEDPAPRLLHDLLDAAQSHYGIVLAALPPVPAGSTTADPIKLVKSASGADLVFDIQGMGSEFRYLPFHWDQYVVDSGYKFRVIDVSSAQVVAEGFCRRETDSKHAVSKNELLADRAARLKDILETQRQACLEEFKQKVLGIRSQ